MTNTWLNLSRCTSIRINTNQEYQNNKRTFDWCISWGLNQSECTSTKGNPPIGLLSRVPRERRILPFGDEQCRRCFDKVSWLFIVVSLKHCNNTLFVFTHTEQLFNVWAAQCNYNGSYLRNTRTCSVSFVTVPFRCQLWPSASACEIFVPKLRGFKKMR